MFVCVHYIYAYKHRVEIFAKSLKEKNCVLFTVESLTYSALEVTPCWEVLRIDKLQSVKEVTFYRDSTKLTSLTSEEIV